MKAKTMSQLLEMQKEVSDSITHACFTLQKLTKKLSECGSPLLNDFKLLKNEVSDLFSSPLIDADDGIRLESMKIKECKAFIKEVRHLMFEGMCFQEAYKAVAKCGAAPLTKSAAEYLCSLLRTQYEIAQESAGKQ